MSVSVSYGNGRTQTPLIRHRKGVCGGGGQFYEQFCMYAGPFTGCINHLGVLFLLRQ